MYSSLPLKKSKIILKSRKRLILTFMMKTLTKSRNSKKQPKKLHKPKLMLFKKKLMFLKKLTKKPKKLMKLKKLVKTLQMQVNAQDRYMVLTVQFRSKLTKKRLKKHKKSLTNCYKNSR